MTVLTDNSGRVVGQVLKDHGDGTATVLTREGPAVVNLAEYRQVQVSDS